MVREFIMVAKFIECFSGCCIEDGWLYGSLIFGNEKANERRRNFNALLNVINCALSKFK